MDIIDFFGTLYQIVLIMLCCVAFVVGAGRGRHYWCSKQAKKNNASTLLPPLSEARRVADDISSFLSHVMEQDARDISKLDCDQWLAKDILSGTSKRFHRLVQLAIALGVEFKIVRHSNKDIEDEDVYSRSKKDLTEEEKRKLSISVNQIDIDSFRL